MRKKKEKKKKYDIIGVSGLLSCYTRDETPIVFVHTLITEWEPERVTKGRGGWREEYFVLCDLGLVYTAVYALVWRKDGYKTGKEHNKATNQPRCSKVCSPDDGSSSACNIFTRTMYIAHKG